MSLQAVAGCTPSGNKFSEFASAVNPPYCPNASRAAFSLRLNEYTQNATPPARLKIIPIMKRIEYM